MTTAADEYASERRHAKLSPAKALRIVRELQGLSQGKLAELSGIPQPTISAIESGQRGLGIERAKQLARALKVHPAVLAFPGWDSSANVVSLSGALRNAADAKRAAEGKAKRAAGGRVKRAGSRRRH